MKRQGYRDSRKERKKLEPSPWAEFRIAINQPDDIHKLHRLVFAAFQKTYMIEYGTKGQNQEKASRVIWQSKNKK